MSDAMRMGMRMKEKKKERNWQRPQPFTLQATAFRSIGLRNRFAAGYWTVDEQDPDLPASPRSGPDTGAMRT